MLGKSETKRKEAKNPMAEENKPDPQKEPDTHTQEVRYSQSSARVPEKVVSGVFSSGALLLNGPHEFILDFLQRLVQPHRLASRVVMSPPSFASFINALDENLSMYAGKFGPLPPMPPPPPGAVPLPIDELYAQIKTNDDLLGGVYANAVMISHNPAEFAFDFIATFYPRSVVVSRIYMSAAQATGFSHTLKKGYQQFCERLNPPQGPPKENKPQ
ncbi:MAG: DUF3467 domain-containing protein [Gemmataceae bacterium]|nr:DUF3467 domain-containing protein [Gemmataceae bacterium]